MGEDNLKTEQYSLTPLLHDFECIASEKVRWGCQYSNQILMKIEKCNSLKDKRQITQVGRYVDTQYTDNGKLYLSLTYTIILWN